MRIPHIDKLIGISTYSSVNQGIGGHIRVKKCDFQVEEIIDPQILINLSPKPISQNKIPIFSLTKKGVDTLHAVRTIENWFKVRFRFLGIKDANAYTTQYLSAPQKSNLPEEFSKGSITIRLLGYYKTQLDRSLLIGNCFNIIIRDIELSKDAASKIIDDSNSLLINNGILNFYGCQRFGARRPVTHLIGREIVKRNFDSAIKILITFTTEFENSESQNMRNLMNNGDYSKILKIIPRRMDIERIVLTALIKNPKDSIQALRKIPLRLRRLYVNAYQAYLFNKTLSLAKERELDLQKIFTDDIFSTLGYNSLDLGEIEKARFETSDKKLKQSILLCPIVGYGFRETKVGRIGEVINEVLKDEGVASRSFYIDEMQELSSEGGFRSTSLRGTNLSRDFNDNLKITMSLGKGSYATTFLRELMKPDSPLESGF